MSHQVIRARIWILALGLWAGFTGLEAAEPVISVDAGKVLCRTSPMLNGTNLEDLNHQCNGGVSSQLLDGEAFAEGPDVDFLSLELKDYVKVYMVMDENGDPLLGLIGPRLWQAEDPNYDVTLDQARGEGLVGRQKNQDLHLGDMVFKAQYLLPDDMPDKERIEMYNRAKGPDQISRAWHKVQEGSAEGLFQLVRRDPYMGRQAQGIRVDRGSGEMGIDNAGLNRQGIYLIQGRPYEGLLRIKAEKVCKVFVSLRAKDGTILDERALSVKAVPSQYQKVEFKLLPKFGDRQGRFAVSLKEPGEIVLGFAFLQPGPTGRVNGYPLRKEFVEALRKQGIKVIRYNGSMIDRAPDGQAVRWKKMIGPIDERRVVYRSGFNPYATHSFAILEFLQLAEVLGATPVVGLHMDETPQDIRDLMEYVNGRKDTAWGSRRAKDGHPEPYSLSHIEIHNEQDIGPYYIERFKALAQAAWAKDPNVRVLVSLNVDKHCKKERDFTPGGEPFKLAQDLVRWVIEQGKADRFGWDSHYAGQLDPTDARLYEQTGLELQDNLAKVIPGFHLRLYPLEENGWQYDWGQGLAHAQNWNTLSRYGDRFQMAATASTFGPWDQEVFRPRGRISYDSWQIWFQASAYVDRMFADPWLTQVVEVRPVAEQTLDCLAKRSDDGKVLMLYVANLADKDQPARLDVTGFSLGSRVHSMTLGGCDLDVRNTPDNQEAIAPVEGNWDLTMGSYTFPRYSLTRLRFDAK